MLRRLGLAAATVMMGMVCGSCSTDEDVTAAELMDDYGAGYEAGAPMVPESGGDQDRCQTLTFRRYDMARGFNEAAGNEALVFWQGCLDGLLERPRKSTPEEVATLLEE